MPARRAIKAVLHNFLGTYTSRYSDYGGYWLFGFIVNEFERVGAVAVEYDLLVANRAMTDPLLTFAADLAAEKFARQLMLAGFDPSSLQSARVVITKERGSVEGQVNARQCMGHMVHFAAYAVSDHGKSYAAEKRVFVAPHDPWVEWRSARG